MIQPTSNFPSYRTDAYASGGTKTATAPGFQPAQDDRLSSANSQALRSALESSPEVRPEVVEQGRKLAVDPNYPPRELIERLAKLLVETRDPSEQV